jgi:hypothetical protein
VRRLDAALDFLEALCPHSIQSIQSGVEPPHSKGQNPITHLKAVSKQD